MEQRNYNYDIIKGIAVTIMIFANATPKFAVEYSPLFRFIFSLVAPTFAVMFGFMIQMHHTRHQLRYYLQKVIFLIGVGALIDIYINNIAPFITIDILYFMGISLPIIYVMTKTPINIHLLAILAILVISPVLRNHFGFTFIISEENIKILSEDGIIFTILRHWIVDGWFPIFPWLAIALFGSFLSKIYNQRNITDFSDKKFIYFAGSLLIAGLIIYYPYQFNDFREGYSEVFYPATNGFILTVVGIISLTLVILTKSQAYTKLYNLLKLMFINMGRTVLAMYIIHLMVITYLSKTFSHGNNHYESYISLCITNLIICYIAAYGLKKVREKFKGRMPTMVGWIIGK